VVLPDRSHGATRRRPAAILVLGLVVATVLAGCAGRSEEKPSPWSPYVAIGDSYTAAPLVAEPQGTDECRRSTNNYPSIVARRLQIGAFSDRSCVGAAIKDVTTSQAPGVAPQIEAIDASTRLVTVGMGGNDLGTATMMLVTCPGLRKKDPTGAPCRDAARRDGSDPFATGFGVVTDRLVAMLQAVHRRAPSARVLVVGYPSILPAHGGCSAFPLARGDDDYVRALNRALNQAVQDAARRTDDTYVDVAGASVGHDICSTDPWINGSTAEAGVANAYHPLRAEEEAVARLVIDALADGKGDATP
jgi:lysophospholipase L1-like esterase